MRFGNNQQVRDLKKEIAELVDKENRLWFQRSKVLWEKFGDRNSKYFHSHASQRKRKNLIRKLKDSNGRVVENNEGIAGSFESLHSMQKYTEKEGYMAIKLDMSKAYNGVEWSYLQSVMEKMGFTEHWINLMMLCVRTMTYSILVNGEPKGMITPSRGIR
ncbi:uncharacterized protein LOC115949985 [Quercus lobata]|uniref:uncharacterized protein LOC115949985 n=1 Tax=Quercus lobata TaxID=97700 RepID=UPI001246E7D3|nr:uncharacterized protein LOC115949985 [Quercus lobata]